MSKLLIVVVIFLVIGGLVIHQDATGKKDFTKKYLTWLYKLGKNIKSILGNAITGYSWMPKTNDSDLKEMIIGEMLENGNRTAIDG